MMETIEDIIAEIRDCTKNQGAFFDDTVNEWTDRIESALKRERDLRSLEISSITSEMINQMLKAEKVSGENKKLRDALIQSKEAGDGND